MHNSQNNIKKLLLGVSIATVSLLSQLPSLPVMAEEITYKIRLREIAAPKETDSFMNNIAPIDPGRQEWAVIKVIDNQKVKLLHTTRINGNFGFSRWFDHPVSAIRVCTAAVFDVNDTKNCQITMGDTITLPADKSVHDFSYDIKYTEGGIPYIRSVQVPSNLKPKD